MLESHIPQFHGKSPCSWPVELPEQKDLRKIEIQRKIETSEKGHKMAVRDVLLLENPQLCGTPTMAKSFDS